MILLWSITHTPHLSFSLSHQSFRASTNRPTDSASISLPIIPHITVSGPHIASVQRQHLLTLTASATKPFTRRWTNKIPPDQLHYGRHLSAAVRTARRGDGGSDFFFFFSLPFFFFGCPLRKVFIGVVRKEGRWRIVSAFPFTVFGNMMARLEGYFEVSLFRDAVHPQTRSALGSRSKGGSTGVCRRLRVAFLRILYVFSLFSSFLLLLGAV